MDLRKILAISGKPGLFTLQKEHGNRLIVKSLLTKRSQSISINRNNFSVLETVEIYTTNEEEGSMSLPEVIRSMFTLDEAGTSTPDAKKGSDEDLRAYFTKAVPDHDPDRVYISHIKKIVKWYDLLKENDLVDMEIIEPEVEEENAENAEGETKAEDA